jgi:hypothetical protein
MMRFCLVAVVMLVAFASGRGDNASELVERATAALKSDWAADPAFACDEKDETQKGPKVTSKTVTVLMIDGSDYHFPLAVNDQPLTPERRKAELAKLRAEVNRRRAESESTRRARIEAWKKQRDENGELLLDFPTALDFQLTGEEVKDGRSAYVFAGTPKPGLVPTTRAAKVLTGIRGKAWVDKETLHPIRVECTVFKPVPVFGPLASVLPGTDIEISMTRVSNSVWLIDSVAMKLNLSKLHLMKSSEVTRSTYTHYRLNEQALEELLSEANRER